METSNSFRKRNRPSRVCDFCKRRKIKCDLKEPCSTCLKYGNSNCTYTSSKKISSGGLNSDNGSNDDDVRDELRLLKRQIRELEQSVSVKKVDGISPSEEFNLGKSIPSKDYPELKATHEGLHIMSRGKYGSKYDHMFGFNPKNYGSDTIPFHEGYSSLNFRLAQMRSHFGPLSGFSLLKMDSAMRCTYDFLQSKLSWYKIRKQAFGLARDNNGRFQDSGVPDAQEKPDFQEKIRSEFENATEYDETTLSQQNAKMKFNKTGFAVGISLYEGDLKKEQELAKKVELVLPPRNVIWKLIDRFFTNLYALIPIVDEDVVRKEFERLLGASNGPDRVEGISVKNRLDFSYLGLLLVMLRLSYLTLFSGVTSINRANFNSQDPSHEAQCLKLLLNNPVEIDVIDVARLCLFQFNLSKHIGLSIFQLCMFITFYQQVAPEDGQNESGGFSHCALIVRMAYTLGLHRDPDRTGNSHLDKNLIHLSRKIWYVLLSLDMEFSAATGLPTLVNATSFDTKMAGYTPGISNVKDEHVENMVCSIFPSIERIFEPLCKIMQDITNVRNPVSLDTLLQNLDKLEIYFLNEIDTLRETLEVTDLSYEETYAKVIRLRLLFNVSSFLSAVYLHVFNHHERKNNSREAMFFLKKMLVVTVFYSSPFLREIKEFGQVVSKHLTDLTIISVFQSSMHKTMLVLYCTLLRLRYQEAKYGHESKFNSQKLTKAKQLIWDMLNIIEELLTDLSRRYYNSWKLCKGHQYSMKVIGSDEVINETKAKFQGLVYDNAMLDEIIDVLESSIDTYRKQKTPEGSMGSMETTSIDDSAPISVVTSADGNNASEMEEVDTMWMQMISFKNPFDYLKQDSNMNWDQVGFDFPHFMEFGDSNNTELNFQGELSLDDVMNNITS